VSFDTFDKPAEFIEENSFTLITKHKDYEYTKRSRTFLCGCDDNEYSEYALQWLIDELVDDGDEIVCLRVLEKDDTIAGDRSVEKGRYRKEAETLMSHIQNKNNENKAINLILEFAVGKVNKVIDEMVSLDMPTYGICTTHTIADQPLRAGNPCCRHSRSKSRGFPRLAPRFGLQILPTALPCSSHCRPTLVQTRQSSE
jgi:hypothetical protein